MSKKIVLWEGVSLLESQIQDVRVFDFRHFNEVEREKDGKEIRYMAISSIALGIVAGLIFRSSEVGFGVWLSAILFLGLLNILRDKFFPENKPGEINYKVLVTANIAGDIKKFESKESWDYAIDADVAAKGILNQMESDALRQKH